MATKVRWINIAIILTVVISLAIVLMFPSSSIVGMVLRVGSVGLPLSQTDFTSVPQSVVEDATRLAIEVYGGYEEEYSDFVEQLLALYLEAKDKDFAIFFNSGGWGWNILGASSEWNSIFGGIQSHLVGLDYTVLVLNYQRAQYTLRGYFDEFMSMISLYPSQAKDLASRVEFLIRHNADLRVIIAGESTGAVIADTVMSILKDNPQVYSIQTGPPFWHKNTMLDRTLVLRTSGLIPDTFSEGDFLAILSANLEALFGFYQPEEYSGKILLYIGAPGHEYWWHHHEVYSQITKFLEQNFGLK